MYITEKFTRPSRTYKQAGVFSAHFTAHIRHNFGTSGSNYLLSAPSSASLLQCQQKNRCFTAAFQASSICLPARYRDTFPEERQLQFHAWFIPFLPCHLLLQHGKTDIWYPSWAAIVIFLPPSWRIANVSIKHPDRSLLGEDGNGIYSFAGYCWNEANCQFLSRDCHPECIDCSQPRSAQHCYACKKYRDNGTCVSSCPENK